MAGAERTALQFEMVRALQVSAADDEQEIMRKKKIQESTWMEMDCTSRLP